MSPHLPPEHNILVLLESQSALLRRVMQAYKLCYTTIVLDDRYAAVPGVEYYDVLVDGKTLKFAQHSNTVLPAMLQEMVSCSHSTSVLVLPLLSLSVFSCSSSETFLCSTRKRQSYCGTESWDSWRIHEMACCKPVTIGSGLAACR